MKKNINILILILTLLTSTSFAQNYFYYNGEKIPLKLSTEKILIKFKEEVSFETQKQATLINSKIKLISKEQIYPGNVAIVEIEKRTSEEELRQIITRLHQNKNIICATIFMIYEKDSIQQGISDRFIISLKSPADYSELERLAYETNPNNRFFG